MATTTAIDRQRENPVSNLRSLLEKASGEIAKALPKHLTAERMIRAAITAFQVTPALQECSALSIVGCVIQAGQLGLELSGPLGQSFLVPYYNKNTKQKEAQFQVGWRGLIRLAYNSGQVSYFNAHEVREGDAFDYEYGTNQFLKHKPARKGRGNVTDFYSCIRLKDGGSDFEVMSVEEVRAHQKQYSKQKGEWSPWATAFDEMGKKTLVRRLAKRCPVSPEMVQVAVEDEYREHQRMIEAQREATAGLSRSEALALALSQRDEAADEPGPSDDQRQQDPPHDDEVPLPVDAIPG